LQLDTLIDDDNGLNGEGSFNNTLDRKRATIG